MIRSLVASLAAASAAWAGGLAASWTDAARSATLAPAPAEPRPARESGAGNPATPIRACEPSMRSGATSVGGSPPCGRDAEASSSVAPGSAVLGRLHLRDVPVPAGDPQQPGTGAVPI